MNLDCHVQKKYSGFHLDVRLAADTSRLGVFGPSGSGKTTWVHCLAGLVRPEGGHIRMGGEMLFHHGRRLDVPAEKRRVAMVFQQPALFPHLDVKGNLFFGVNPRAPRLTITQTWNLITVLGLEDKLARKVTALSGGEQQRVAIGRALMSVPRLLILDEPVNALDEDLKTEVLRHVKILCKHLAIPYVFISHNSEEIRMMSDTVAVFSQGRILSQAPLQTWLDERRAASAGKTPVQGVFPKEGVLAHLDRFHRTITSGQWN